MFGLEEIGCEGMDCIDLAHGRDEWRHVVMAVMKNCDTINAGR